MSQVHELEGSGLLILLAGLKWVDPSSLFVLPCHLWEKLGCTMQWNRQPVVVHVPSMEANAKHTNKQDSGHRHRIRIGKVHQYQ